MDGPGGKLLPPAIHVYRKWLNFEELYEISYLEIDLHILNLNLLGRDCCQGKFRKADYNKTSAHAQLHDVR